MPQDNVAIATDDSTENTGTITTSSILASTGKYDLATVYKLAWCHKDVQSTQGLEGLVNLVELDLSGNKISQISGLQNLQHLQKLVLAKNRITVVDSCLVSLTQLEHLLLQGNPILNIEGLNLQHLSKLKRLSTLYFKNVNGTEACPCCHAKDYKRTVLIALPNLRNFDGERNPLSSSCFSNLVEPATAVHEQMKNFQPDFTFCQPKSWIEPLDLQVPDVPQIKHYDTVRALCGRLENRVDFLIRELNQVSDRVQHNIRVKKVTCV